jgi:hypothetical protein
MPPPIGAEKQVKMKRTYLCPHCKAVLNPSTKIILRAQVDDKKALFLFSPQPGNYDVIIPEGFPLRKKDRVAFSCPVCTKDLTSARDDTLAEISFTSSTSSGTVAFSTLFGYHATYFITAEDVRSYGEHAANLDVNFWGEGPER